MIVVLRPDATDEQVTEICRRVQEKGLDAHVSRGERRTVVGCVGDETRLSDVPPGPDPDRAGRKTD